MKLRQQLSVTGLAFVLLSSSADIARCIGFACENIPNPAGNDLVIPFLSKNGQCEMDAYVQMSASGYALDVKAEAWGSCDIYTPNGGGGCSYVRTEHRGITGVNIQDQALGIGGGQQVFNNNPSNAPAPHIFDTRVQGTTSPENAYWSFNVEGERTLRYLATIYTTAGCNMQPGSKTETFRVTALRCLPIWLRPNANAPVIRNEPQQIFVYVDPAFGVRGQSVRDIITAVNTALDPYRTGVSLPTYTPTTTPCAGPYCINFVIDSSQVPGGSCAGGAPNYNPSTGYITSSTIYFPNNSSTLSDSFVRTLAGHELMHHLGLENNPNYCPSGANGSLMRTPFNCSGVGTYPTSPTSSDNAGLAKRICKRSNEAADLST